MKGAQAVSIGRKVLLEKSPPGQTAQGARLVVLWEPTELKEIFGIRPRGNALLSAPAFPTALQLNVSFKKMLIKNNNYIGATEEGLITIVHPAAIAGATFATDCNLQHITLNKMFERLF